MQIDKGSSILGITKGSTLFCKALFTGPSLELEGFPVHSNRSTWPWNLHVAKEQTIARTCKDSRTLPAVCPELHTHLVKHQGLDLLPHSLEADFFTEMTKQRSWHFRLVFSPLPSVALQAFAF